MKAGSQPRTPETAPAERAVVLVVGCGRPFRQDGQAGLILALRLHARRLRHVRVVATESPGTDLLTDLAGVELLIIVDAAQAEPRTTGWRRLPVVEGRVDHIDEILHELEPRLSHSTHHLGVREALHLGRDLAALPATVWVYAIPASDFGYGDHLSDMTRHAVDELTRRLPDDIAAWLAAREARHA